MVTLRRDCAIVPLERQFATVVEEPCLKETRLKGQIDYIAHFLARGKDGALIECTALHKRALEVAHDLNVGDEVAIDLSVIIKPVLDALEYTYKGMFICINKRN